jgi:hypothetical protein
VGGNYTMSKEYEKLSGKVMSHGQPYGGESLKWQAGEVQVTCRQCGSLLPRQAKAAEPGLHGWSSDWLTLCQEGRRHALEAGAGHDVALGLWLGAVYAPVDGNAQEDEHGVSGDRAG